VILVSENSVVNVPHLENDVDANLTFLIKLENSLPRVKILSPDLDLIFLFLDVKLNKLGALSHALALFLVDPIASLLLDLGYEYIDHVIALVVVQVPNTLLEH